MALGFENTPDVSWIDFLGYGYARVPSAVSGALQIVYDDTKPQVWHLPMRSGVRVTASGRPPKAGYLVPRAWVPAVRDRLMAHGIRVVEITAASTRSGAR